MGSKEWILLTEAFWKFKNEAKKARLFAHELKVIEAALAARCPIPERRKS